MKQAAQDLKTGGVSVPGVPPRRLHRPGAFVATLSSLISAGTEHTKVELGERSILGKAGHGQAGMNAGRPVDITGSGAVLSAPIFVAREVGE